jgi:hypothetical protein
MNDFIISAFFDELEKIAVSGDYIAEAAAEARKGPKAGTVGARLQRIEDSTRETSNKLQASGSRKKARWWSAKSLGARRSQTSPRPLSEVGQPKAIPWASSHRPPKALRRAGGLFRRVMRGVGKGKYRPMGGMRLV